MAHLRNVHLSRILNALKSKEEKSTNQIPKQILSMDELNYNIATESNPNCYNFLAQDALIIDKSGSLSLLQDQDLPQSPSHIITETEYYNPSVGEERPIPHDIVSATNFIELAPMDAQVPVVKLAPAEELTPVEVLPPAQDLSVLGPSNRARSISTSSESSSSSNASSTSSSSSSSSASEKDFSPDDAVCDPDYALPTTPRQISFSLTMEKSTSIKVLEENNLSSAKENIIPNKRKRKGLKNMPVKQETKRLRNCGQEYISTSKLKKVIPKKQMGPPCNFTISELAKDYCDCFVWSEVEASRGANEISSCVLRYLTKRASEINDGNLQITFYSDNCCSQQKNKFMFSMYVYAVTVLKIKSITHKYLISGHTQNENDSVHSIIEKAVKKCLRSGQIYTPDQYDTIIRTARKKGNPYNVTEMCYLDFVDIKNLTEACGGQFFKNIQGEIVRMSDFKIIKFEKHQDSGHIGIYYKTSYLDTEFKET